MVGQVRVNLMSGDGLPSPIRGVEIVTRGGVGTAEAAYARASVGEVLAETGQSDGARVRLLGAACGGPALVQVNLLIHGARARVQVAGASPAHAVDRAAQRLRRQILRLTTAYEPWPWPDPERRPLGVPAAGKVRRHKSYRLHAGSACQAAAFMNAMDYDVMLYTDAQTGEDAVVYRSGPTGLRLARQESMHPPAAPASLPLTVNAHRVPTLAPAPATRRLVEGWLPFLFFTDSRTRRGSLLYRRYDGELGLITAR